MSLITNDDTVDNNKEMSLNIPINKKELGEFIYGLLGQQQSIERIYNIKFDINHNWLINLHELLNQRVHRQADATLVSFTLVVYLEEGLKRTFTSIEAFKAYSETRKQLPVGVKIVWGYLVQFPDKEHPEKQQISFSAHKHSDSSEDKKEISKNKYSLESILNRMLSSESERSSIRFQIDHTERTWGDDLEVIISNHIDEISRKDSSTDVLYDLSRFLLALLIFGAGIFYPLFLKLVNYSEKIHNVISDYLLLSNVEPISLDLINTKINKISELVALNATKDENSFFIAISMVVGTIIAIVMLELTKRKTFSFLVLSNESVKYREDKLKKEKRSGIILIASFGISIIGSIIASYSYTWLSN